jgi:hypothetical protein
MAITSKEHKTGSFFIKNNFEGESWVGFSQSDLVNQIILKLI